MKKVKLSLIVALVALSSMMAQQSVSMDTNKFEMTSTTSNDKLVATVNTEKEAKVEAEKVITNADFKMYPNPASDIVTLQGVSVDDEIIVLDNNGKKWIKIKAKAEVEIIPIDHLKSGIYTISINGTNKKLVKE